MPEDTSRPKNIFEAVSKIEKARHEKDERRSPLDDQREKLKELFLHCQQMHDEITIRLDKALEKGGVTASQVRSYVSKSQNFSSKDWKLLEEQRIRNEELLKKVGPKAEKKGLSQEPPSGTEAPKQEPPHVPTSPHEAPPHPRRPKPITKRQWLGMR